jgi:hypothetical protein
MLEAMIFFIIMCLLLGGEKVKQTEKVITAIILGCTFIYLVC